MSRMFDAIEGLRSVARSVTLDSGFGFNLADVVLDAVIKPAEINNHRPGIIGELSPWYYVCIAPDSQVTNNPNGARVFTVPIVGYVGEPQYDPLKSDETQFICQLWEDLEKAIDETPQLRGTCQNARVLGGRYRSGWPTKSVRNGEFIMNVEVEQYV